jgi:hypothetical protein
MGNKKFIPRCPICKGERQKAFSASLLSKYMVDYFYCENCGLLQTEEPYWLEEAYSCGISNLDTGAVRRNVSNSKLLSCILYKLFPSDGKFVDIGGGYGLLTRLMRDIGFNYYWDDKYCENLFARGFQATNDIVPVDAVSCFEVLEHIYKPMSFINNIINNYETKTILFSTVIFEGQPYSLNWWYYSFGSGQHISFYQKRTLQWISRYYGLKLYSLNDEYHIITDKPINAIYLKALSRRPIFNVAYGVLKIIMKLKMKSMTERDRLYLSQLSPGKSIEDQSSQ